MNNIETPFVNRRVDYIAQSMRTRLTESSIRDLGHNICTAELLTQLQQADPESGKNIQFIANMYAKNQFKLEDVHRIKNSISIFLQRRARLPIKDLNQIKDLAQLYSLTDDEESVDDIDNYEMTSNNKSVRLIYTQNFKVIIPRTKEDAYMYGKDTKWCTSTPDEEHNRYDYYASQGDLYIILATINCKIKKFQLHAESNQFMDKNDLAVSPADIAELSKIPEYTKFLNFLIKKHYSQYFK